MPKRFHLTYAEMTKFTQGRTMDPQVDGGTPTHLVPGVLASMGIDCTVDVLRKLPRDTGGEFPIAPRGRSPKWTPDLIDRAAHVLAEKGRFDTYTALLRELGLTLRDFYTALWNAYHEAIKKHGKVAKNYFAQAPDPYDFNWILSPAYGKRKASIAFALQDEVIGLFQNSG